MNVLRRTVCVLVCLLAGVLAMPAAHAEDLPPPDIIGGPPSYGPTSIARPAGEASAARGWTSPPPPPPPSAWTAPVRDAVPQQPMVVTGTPVAPRFVRSTRRPYDITAGNYRPRGPVEIRDEWLLAQPKMTLPAMSPDPLPKGQWRLHFYINRGNDFGFNQTGPAENPIDRRFLVDGEHQTTALDVRFGASDAFVVGARLPVHWRGGGFMDDIIDWFHELTEGIGFKDNGRPAFRTDLYRIEGRDDNFNAINWNDQRGTGLGRLELNAQWNVLRPCRRCDWRAAVTTRVTLPTGSGPFDNGGVDVGLQATVAKQIANRWDLYAGLGGTWFSETEIDGILYEDVRGWGFFAAEWHAGRNISLVLQTDAASRLVTNLAEYPALSWYIHFSCRWDLSQCFEVEFGFTENIEDQQGTIDFGVFGGFTWRF